MTLLRGDASPPRAAWIPVVLGFVAGYVDGCTMLGLFGLFVAQVTGSYVIAGAKFVVSGEGTTIAMLGVPVFLLAGVATTIFVTAMGRTRRALTGCLTVEVVLLAGLMATATLASLRENSAATLVASCLGLAAMGVQSAFVRLLLDLPSTNVMTTNTTQLAIDATETVLALLDRRQRPHDASCARRYASALARLFALAPLCCAFLVGTIAGAGGYLLAGFLCIVLPMACLLAFIVWSMRA